MKKAIGWGVFAAVTAWMWWSGETAGVLLSNQIPDRVQTELQSVGLDEGEKVAAFTEFSLGTLSEYAAITNRRLLYSKDGRLTSIPHEEISSIEMGDAMVGGDLVVVSESGEILRLELANDPELFLRVLEEQKKNVVTEADVDTRHAQGAEAPSPE